MSCNCNNCCRSYYSYYAYPCFANNSCYNLCQTSSCDPCNSCNPCQTVGNPCQTVCNPCPNVTFIATAPTATTITPSPVLPAPLPQIPPNTTNPAVAGVIPLTGFTAISTNCGGISFNTSNGQFTVPIAGRYDISGMVGFVESTNPPTGLRSFSIYRIDASTGIISLLASDTRAPVANGNTYISLSTVADLRAGDRIFFTASQNQTSQANLLTTTDTRVAITRIC